MTQYATIENGEVAGVGPRPRWRDDAGNPVSDEVLVQHGRLPVRYNPPEHDPRLQRISLNDKSEWAIESDRVVATYTVHDVPIETLRDDKLQQATDMRWDVMTGGLTLPNGVAVGTTIDDQNRITSAVANAELAGLTDADEVDFKASSGWVRVTIAEVKAIAGAIGQFVQACYSAERAHHEAIEKLKTPEQIAQYDVTQGWPLEPGPVDATEGENESPG